MKDIHSVGIIMDGNRRWATARGLHAWDGHRAGVEALKRVRNELPRLEEKYSITHITLYAFSTENWSRSKEEKDALFAIFKETLEEFLAADENFVFKIIGETERLPRAVQKRAHELEQKTASHTGGVITLALSYGGRAEILSAVNRLVEKGTPVTEEEFKEVLWSKDIPDPDIIIRTGGEQRLSNFLTWGSAYAELFFTDTLWPDFTVSELESIFDTCVKREQRHGT